MSRSRGASALSASLAILRGLWASWVRNSEQRRKKEREKGDILSLSPASVIASYVVGDEVGAVCHELGTDAWLGQKHRDGDIDEVSSDALLDQEKEKRCEASEGALRRKGFNVGQNRNETGMKKVTVRHSDRVSVEAPLGKKSSGQSRRNGNGSEIARDVETYESVWMQRHVGQDIGAGTGARRGPETTGVRNSVSVNQRCRRPALRVRLRSETGRGRAVRSDRKEPARECCLSRKRPTHVRKSTRCTLDPMTRVKAHATETRPARVAKGVSDSVWERRRRSATKLVQVRDSAQQQQRIVGTKGQHGQNRLNGEADVYCQ
ncbi:hypothetical protein B0H13DRAFT_1907132 [Mycena leptocephala]|nr:hypothetical protein B0H13DRAFT_1907132 [Mycena leptocephala]